ncbi:MAG: hypothetical protein U9N36_07510, partial [Euryarchaeota archaeon]|nr:hypothetical protein [Euryarchaeota archaeon]
KFTKHYLELSFLYLNIVRKCLRKYEQSTLRPYAFIGATGIADLSSGLQKLTVLAVARNPTLQFYCQKS